VGHKANKSFFDRKRPWSKRKDLILAYYLEPYLAKVRRLGRPVLLVDCFAGPGKFGDGEPGSPLIMCAKVQAAMGRPGPEVRIWCVEPDPDLFGRLQENLTGFPFAIAKQKSFLDVIDEVGEAARTHTVFLYLDPYTPADIDYEAIDRVAQQIQSAGASVELLMNFNTPSFTRWGMAALVREVPAPDPENEDTEEFDVPTTEPPGADRLTRVVGGMWWRDILDSEQPFWKKVNSIADGVERSLRPRFNEVCWVGIRARREHPIPKYHMFFGSRHPDALELMNDAMVKARGYSDFQVDLFADEPADRCILESASDWIPRGELIRQTIRRAFCRYYRKDIRGCVERLLKSGTLESETGKLRINDGTLVRQK